MSVSSSAVSEMKGRRSEPSLPEWHHWLEPAGMLGTLPIALYAERFPLVVQLLAIAVLGALWLVRLWRRNGRAVFDFLSLPVFALVLLFVPISVWISPLPEITMARTTLLLWGMGLFSWIANDTREQRWKLVTWVRLFVGLGASTAVVGFLGMGEWIPESFTYPGGVPENELAGALLVFLAPVVGFVFAPKKLCPAPRWLLVLVALAILLTLVATKSRGGLAGAALSMVVLVVLMGNRQVVIASLLAGIGGLCGLLALWSDPEVRVFLLGGTLQGASLDTFFSGRFSIWEEAVLVIGDSPLTGVGVGTFGAIMDAAFTPAGGARHLEDAHQQFLQAGTDFGLAGAVCWVWLWGGIFGILRKLLQRLRSGKLPRLLAAGLLAAFSGFILYNLLDSVSPGWVGQIGFWFLAGLAVRMRRQVMGREASRGWLQRGLVPLGIGFASAGIVVFAVTGGIGQNFLGAKLHRQLLQSGYEAHDVSADDRANFLWLSGVAKFRAGDESSCYELWGKLVTESPRHWRFVRSMQPESVELAELAVQSSNKNAEGHFWLSKALEQSDPDRSLTLLRSGLALAPESGREWLRLGEALTGDGGKGTMEEALAAYGNACRHGDPGANGCVRAGGLAEQLGRSTEALHYYRLSNWEVGQKRARELDPSSARRPMMTYVWSILAVGLVLFSGWFLFTTQSLSKHMRNSTRHWKTVCLGGGGAVVACLLLMFVTHGAPSVPVPEVLPGSTFPDARMQLVSTALEAGQQSALIDVPSGFDANDCIRCGVSGNGEGTVSFSPGENGNQVEVTIAQPEAGSRAVHAFFWKTEQSVASAEYFVSVSGSADSAGTESNPWDLRSALDGSQEVEPGAIIWCKGGTYSDPQRESGLYRSYQVALKGAKGAPIHIRPLPGEHVLIEGGFGVNAPAAYLWIGGFEFANSDPIPGGEPTPPGSVPKPLPDGFDDWGGAGVAVMSGANHVIYNNVTRGGSHAFSTWNSAPGTVISGNIAYDAGWIGTDRAHGHCIYAQNTPATGTKLVRHNLFAVRSRKVEGNYALHFYATGPVLGGFRVWENAVKGPIVVQSENAHAEAIEFQNNLVCSVIVGKTAQQDGRGNSFGKEGQPDKDIKLRHNVFINGVKRLENNGWEKVDAEANRVIKTDENWWVDEMGQSPAMKVKESGDFVDYSKGGADEFRLWPNEFEPGRAHVAVLDFDRDGMVAIDPGAFLKSGDRYSVFHYKAFHPESLRPANKQGVYTGKPIQLPLVEADDALDMFVLLKR